MKKHFEAGAPVAKSRAAVVHFDLDVTFIYQEQMELFVKFLAEETYTTDFGVEFIDGGSIDPDT